MHYLSLDTNTWIYLANGTEPVKLLRYIEEQLESQNITLLVPALVLEEWNRNKHSTVKEGVLQQFKKVSNDLDQFLKLLGEGARGFENFLEQGSSHARLKSIKDNLRDYRSDLEGAVTENVWLIDKILSHKNAIEIPIEAQIYVKAGEAAIKRKAPVVNKNSYADAIIIFSLLDYLKNHSISRALFVTYNTSDFCQNTKDKKLHADLKEDFTQARCLFFTSVGEALNTIEKDLLSLAELKLIRELQAERERERLFEKENEFNPHICRSCENHEYRLSFKPMDLVDERLGPQADPRQFQIDFGEELKIVFRHSLYMATCELCQREHFMCFDCGYVNDIPPGKRVFSCDICQKNYRTEKYFNADQVESRYYVLEYERSICQHCHNYYQEDGSNASLCPDCKQMFSAIF